MANRLLVYSLNVAVLQCNDYLLAAWLNLSVFATILKLSERSYILRTSFTFK